MPAQLTSRDWMVSGNRTVPWHGIGEVVEGVLTAKEAFEKSHLNYAVEVRNVAVLPRLEGLSPEEQQRVLEQTTAADLLRFEDEWRATMRVNADGSEEVLSRVGGDYTTFQNKDVFDFMEAVCETGRAKYETAGSLYGGRRIFILARMDECDFVVSPEDEVKAFLCAASSHDGSLLLSLMTTDIRVVCNNTLQAAFSDATRIFRIRHTANLQERVREAQEKLGLVVDYSKQFQALADSLAQTPYTMPDMRDLAEELHPAKKDDDDKLVLTPQAAKARSEILTVYALEGARTPATANTAWAAWNAVGERLDHKPSRSAQDRRFSSIMFGDIARQKDAALRIIGKQTGVELGLAPLRDNGASQSEGEN